MILLTLQLQHRLSFFERITGQRGIGFGSEVSLWVVTSRSSVFPSGVVVHRLAEPLFATEISLSCLNRCMAQIEFAARQMA